MRIFKIAIPESLNGSRSTTSFVIRRTGISSVSVYSVDFANSISLSTWVFWDSWKSKNRIQNFFSHV